MVQPNLPRHIVERVERRWAAAFSQQVTRRSEEMKEPSSDRKAQTLEKRSAQPMAKRSVLNCWF